MKEGTDQIADNKKEPEFFFETPNEEAMGIQTKLYPNGKKVKQCKLSSGKIAVVRTLFGRDNKEIFRRVGNIQDNYQNAQISVATTLDGEQLVFEDIEDMPLKDLNLIMVANNAINF